MILKKEILENLADIKSDFAQGDDEYNCAIKILALQELLRQANDQIDLQQATIASLSTTSTYWYKKAKELGHVDEK